MSFVAASGRRTRLVNPEWGRAWPSDVLRYRPLDGVRHAGIYAAKIFEIPSSPAISPLSRRASLRLSSTHVVNAGMPVETEEQANKELKRLERMSDASPEYGMVRGYLDWLINLPWSKLDADAIDLAEARRILDEDHYGLPKIKRRILEYLAVRKLNPEGRSPILCFVGPPGVGKTSLGQSIAKAVRRKFVRLSLGGVHDEAEIRGHRRTYIGALPGNIIQSIRKAGSRNPVMMLDEVDKLGSGAHGDPSAALLEVLDPEQNSMFRDNYLGVPFDLSKVIFIATANMLDTIPGPVRDRMEVIELPGYTEDEKLEIARRYLVERQLKASGLTRANCEITENALRSLIRDYTREAGVRNLERAISSVCRHVAMSIADGSAMQIKIEEGDLANILGPRRFEKEVAMRTSVAGVATGLAWTPTGGDILFIEATRVPGRGHLILTGQLGDVMKESAQAALTLTKARAPSLGIKIDLFEKSDIHVHVPAGAIPKDGPSAGVAMFVALVSLLTGRIARSDTAMTGEISLRGLILPIGGVKEKVLAAARAGISTVLLPSRNRIDLAMVPQLVGLHQGQVGEAPEVGLEAPDPLFGVEHRVVVAVGALQLHAEAVGDDLVAGLPQVHAGTGAQHHAGQVGADDVVGQVVPLRQRGQAAVALEEREGRDRLEDARPDGVVVDRAGHHRHQRLPRT